MAKAGSTGSSKTKRDPSKHVFSAPGRLQSPPRALQEPSKDPLGAYQGSLGPPKAPQGLPRGPPRPPRPQIGKFWLAKRISVCTRVIHTWQGDQPLDSPCWASGWLSASLTASTWCLLTCLSDCRTRLNMLAWPAVQADPPALCVRSATGEGSIDR